MSFVGSLVLLNVIANVFLNAKLLPLCPTEPARSIARPHLYFFFPPDSLALKKLFLARHRNLIQSAAWESLAIKFLDGSGNGVDACTRLLGCSYGLGDIEPVVFVSAKQGGNIVGRNLGLNRRRTCAC